ncbi:MAG: phospholipase effector Tle1 domain-containing protein, partial [Bryobacteraceae bacterium]
KDTNVVWFRDAYIGSQNYWEGVGTRFGLLGKLFGGITGAGAHQRVNEALEKLEKDLVAGDNNIDIVGFSRGAAIALHFANQIQQPIRFLGLWDTVASFGIPGNEENLGFDLNLPDNVQICCQAMALDERRHTFPLQRLEARVADANQPGRLFEVWFRGVHSDIGGGNDNTALSSVALQWMFAAALRAGLRLDDTVVNRNASRINAGSPISVHSFDLIKNRFRVVRWNDVAHNTVRFRDNDKDRQHNNPPLSLALVDDSGRSAGQFGRAAGIEA